MYNCVVLLNMYCYIYLLQDEREKDGKMLVRELIPYGFNFNCRTINKVMKLYCYQV